MPHDLAEIGGFKSHKGDDRRNLGAVVIAQTPGNRRIERSRHQQVKPQDHHDQRNAAHAVDIKRGRQIQKLAARQAHHGQQRTEQHTANRGHHRQQYAEVKALDDEGADDFPVVEREVQIHVSVLPRRPGQ
jgi:hypothetical protein